MGNILKPTNGHRKNDRCLLAYFEGTLEFSRNEFTCP